MSLRASALCSVLALAVVLAGCGGSPSFQDSARSATDKMRQVIETYDGSHPADVASTGAACRKAYDDLGSETTFVSTSSPPARYKREAAQLKAAWQDARAGFRLCAGAAQSMNFPAMAAASDRIQAANAAINKARKLER
jgi:hypothetical protein